MKIGFDIPLWLSLLGYLLFFAMIIGFTIILPWTVPVSIIIATILIGIMTWGIHRRHFSSSVIAILGILAVIMGYIAISGFVYYVRVSTAGKMMVIMGIAGLLIIIFGKRTREIEEFEKFIGFNRPLDSVQKNGGYLLSKFYVPKPRSRLVKRKNKRKFFRKIQF